MLPTQGVKMPEEIKNQDSNLDNPPKENEPDLSGEAEIELEKEDLSPIVEQKIKQKIYKEQNEKRKNPEKEPVLPPENLVNDEGFSVKSLLVLVTLGILGFLGFKIFKKSLEIPQNQESSQTESATIMSADSAQIRAYFKGGFL